MQRWVKRAPALAMLALTGVAGLCELAEQTDDGNKPQYAKRQLLALRNAPAVDESADSPPLAAPTEGGNPTAWLNAETPQFPYLLAISSGDDPSPVIDGVLHGALVIGSRERSASAMASALCRAPTPLGQALQSVAGRWKALKRALHAPDLPDAFDPRVSPTDIARSAILTALKQIHEAEAVDTMDTAEDSTSSSSGAEEGGLSRRFVFVLADLDAMEDKQAEKWLRWTNEVTSAGIAHVVVPTRKAVTPGRVQWLQERHQAGLKGGDFVAILLRVAKDAVDRSTAEDKVHKVASTLGLKLLGGADVASERDDEVKIIANSTGNWWGDICDVCDRLVRGGFADITDKEERLAAIHSACDEFIEDMAMLLVSQALALGTDLGVLHRLRAVVNDGASSPNAPSDSSGVASAEDHALSSLEVWRCLEVMSGLQSAGGGTRASAVGSAQELLARRDRPANCVHPVDALLAFNSRPEGERKFLALIDDDVLLLRPKTDVEIGVVPCETTALLSPCWVEVRPAIKRAFEKLWRDDEYFAAVQALERLSISIHLRDEIRIFEREIHDRQRALDNMQNDFKLRQSALSPAEQAQRKAEIALMQLEQDAKHVYLEKLRSLLS